MVLVVGSTGLLGMEICRLLTEKGTPVKALVRQTSDVGKVTQLKDWGCTVVLGDLKDPITLNEACQGVMSVISTASSTFSRQDGDSIATVDAAGQLSLIEAAKDAGVRCFIFISFPGTYEYVNPLNSAKRAVEESLQHSGMNYTVLQANYFMEVWLSPALGFDYTNQQVRIYGDGLNPSNFISYTDVAKIAVVCLNHPAAQHKTISIGGLASLSPLEVVNIFEKISGQEFNKEFVTQAYLEQQKNDTSDPFMDSFTSLMLTLTKGWPMEMEKICQTFNISPMSIEDYARQVLGK